MARADFQIPQAAGTISTKNQNVFASIRDKSGVCGTLAVTRAGLDKAGVEWDAARLAMVAGAVAGIWRGARPGTGPGPARAAHSRRTLRLNKRGSNSIRGAVDAGDKSASLSDSGAIRSRGAATFIQPSRTSGDHSSMAGIASEAATLSAQTRCRKAADLRRSSRLVTAAARQTSVTLNTNRNSHTGKSGVVEKKASRIMIFLPRSRSVS